MRFPLFITGKSDTNYHGTQSKGEPWNEQTVRGWKVRIIKLSRGRPGISLRFILYFPSGAWRHLDFCTR